jgi:hypothetical protein
VRRRVLGSLVSDVSEDPAALISDVKQSMKTGNRTLFVDCLTSEDEGTTVFRNVGNHSPNKRTLYEHRCENPKSRSINAQDYDRHGMRRLCT